MNERFCSLALGPVLALGFATAGAAKEAPGIVPEWRLSQPISASIPPR
jgi:hypothetical protein